MMIDTKDKLAGILIPTFALRRQGDLGIGDTQAVKEAIDFCARNNTAVLQLLPINETGGDNSPYNAISATALDPVLLTITPQAVPGLTSDDLYDLAKPELLSKLRVSDVDYSAVKRLKLDLLLRAFLKFAQTKGGAVLHDEFTAFKQQERDWLEDYTLFRTLVDVNAGSTAWPHWPENQRTTADAQKWLSQQANNIALTNEREFHAFVQWVAHKQWLDVRAHADRSSVRLMGDIPFGVSRYSADVFANQHLFDLEWSGGAPPEIAYQDDAFMARFGQNWGFPLYQWDAHRGQNFAWWHRRVHSTTTIFHYFRIDHVLGFFRIFSFPWLPECNGEMVYLSDEEISGRTGGRFPRFIPLTDQSREDADKNAAEGKALLLMILAAAGDAGVVAEDLGVVPDYVRPLLKDIGIPGFTIPFWDRLDNREFRPHNKLPELSLATYATHDHPPLVCLYDDMVKRWHGPDGHEGWLEMQRLMRFLGLDDQHPPTQYSEDLHRCFLKVLLETPCWLVVLMITELLASSQRFNQPGTSGGDNWSQRLDHALDWYEQNPPFSDRIALFRQLVKETRRLPLAGQVGTIR